MFASVASVGLVGVEPQPVRVEVHVSGAGSRFSLVGLPDTAVREAKERVQAALASSGFEWPHRNVTVSLAPADLPKAGSAYDLPIAIGVLAAAGVIPASAADFAVLGELALDGAVRPVRGGLAAAQVARRLGLPALVPSSSFGEASLVDDVELLAVDHLTQAVAVACGTASAPAPPLPDQPPPVASHDLAVVKGQHTARRALEIAAAGGHHLLLSGPPGSGKTMLARCLPWILPRLDGPAGLATAQAWAAAGISRADVTAPPFRSPHHSITLAALVGGGNGIPGPGEISLAHNGVLFLDELGEVPMHLLDAMRQPLEEGHIVVARRSGSVRFPARFQLIAATNPCPCGHGNADRNACRCSPRARDRYQQRFSGPLLDRFDLRVDVSAVRPDELFGGSAESSAVVAARVADARSRQTLRGQLNAHLGPSDLDHSAISEDATTLLLQAFDGLQLTARGWDRVRRVSRTIADLDASDTVGPQHMAEAMALRGQTWE